MASKFYLTTTLPYVNAAPHLGFALEIVQADALARYRRLLGDEVFFNFGADEHGQKIWQKAQEAGVAPQAYADEYAAKFANLKNAFNLSYDGFLRTTEPRHQRAAQEFWRRAHKAGDIYKKNYAVKYCIGCELEKTDSELENGQCTLHPNLQIETRAEENYFFRFSKYQDALLKLYESCPDFVVPSFRLNEITTLIKDKGLEDFSISRVAAKMPWGVPVPNDPTQVMYVWFDALISYISTLGWPLDSARGKPDLFHDFWVNGTPTQLAGKDQVRQQAAMWQAMLMSAGLPPTRQIVIHGFIQSGGQKMSKSLGNVLDPFALVREYGTDAVRYFLLRHCHPFEDSDVTPEKIKNAYNADLVNGLGNLVARIMQMAVQYLGEPVDLSDRREAWSLDQWVGKFDFQGAMVAIWSNIAILDELIQKQKPFEVVKKDKKSAQLQVVYLVKELSRITERLKPFMPETAQKIQIAIKEHKKPENLFPRKE